MSFGWLVGSVGKVEVEWGGWFGFKRLAFREVEWIGKQEIVKGWEAEEGH